MVRGARVGYDYFAVSKNDSKIKLMGSGTSPPEPAATSAGLRISHRITRWLFGWQTFRDFP